MTSKGRCLIDQPIVRLRSASINYYLKVSYSVSDPLCLVSLPHDHGAPFHWDKLYRLFRGLCLCVICHESLLSSPCHDFRGVHYGKPLGAGQSH